MPKEHARTDPRAKCRACGSKSVHILGEPPDRCFLVCDACKHRVQICGANRTKHQGRCLKDELNSNGRCRLHGGKSLKGADQPMFRHGRRSKYMPADLVGKFESALSDPNLVSLEEDLATVELLITKEWEAIRIGAPDIEGWKKLAEMVDGLRKIGKDSAVAMVDEGKLQAIELLVLESQSELANARAREDRILAMQESRAKIDRVELARRKYLMEHVDKGAIRMFMAQLFHLAMEIKDPSDRQRFTEGLASLAGSEFSPEPTER